MIHVEECVRQPPAPDAVGLTSAGAPLLARAIGVPAFAQDFGPSGKLGVVGGRDEKALFPGPDLPGGAQTEIRMVQSIHTADGDELEVAVRMKPYDMESWIAEWSRVAERNEELADGYAAAGLKVTAHEFYRRAQDFYSNATLYAAETHPKQLPLYKKYREMFDKAWQMQRPPFERVSVTFEGAQAQRLLPEARRRRARHAMAGGDWLPGRRLDGREHHHGRRRLVRRARHGVSRDRRAGTGRRHAAPGPGAAARYGAPRQGAHRLRGVAARRRRLAHRHAGHQHGRLERAARRERRAAHQGRRDGERLARTSARISSTTTRRSRSGCAGSSAPTISPTRKRKLRDYTTEGVAQKIQAAMVIGYGSDDRIMDPQGAYRLYQAAVNSKRDMMAGLGHPHHAAKAGGPRADRPATLQDWMMRELRARKARTTTTASTDTTRYSWSW